VQSHYFVITGAGIHFIAQILSLKWDWGSYILAPIVILSYLNLMFCLNEKTRIDHIAVLIDTVIFDTFISILLSLSWYLKSLGSIALKCSLYHLILILNDENFDLIIYPLCLCQFLQIFTVYLLERNLKESYV
jgi:cytochrome c biogenesis protein CcdA